jgi:hypothetical protein
MKFPLLLHQESQRRSYTYVLPHNPGAREGVSVEYDVDVGGVTGVKMALLRPEI